MMDELEAALCDYLSYNWDRVDDVMAANQEYLKPEGLSCAWPPAHQTNGGSPTQGGSPMSSSGGWTYRRRSSSMMELNG